MGVHYFHGVFSCLHAHQHEWCQLLFIFYPLLIKISHYLHQIPFLPLPPPEYDTSPTRVGMCIYPNLLHCQSRIIYAELRLLPLFDAPLQETGMEPFLESTVAVPPGLGLRCKFLSPPIIPYFPPPTYIVCVPCYLLIPALHHLPFLCAPPPTSSPKPMLYRPPLLHVVILHGIGTRCEEIITNILQEGINRPP